MPVRLQAHVINSKQHILVEQMYTHMRRYADVLVIFLTHNSAACEYWMLFFH